MDNRSQRQRQRQAAERRKYMQRQRYIRIAAILLALVLAIIALVQSCAMRKDIADLAAQLRAKKLAQAQEELLAAQQAQEAQQAQPSEAPSAAPGNQITLSFVGECTLGVDDNQEEGDLIARYYEDYGPSYFFQNVRSIFEGDGLTTASLVGTLTLNAGERLNWKSAFLADPAYAEVFTGSGVDALTIANEHSHDFSDEGYVDTLANLDNAGIARFGYENVSLVTVNGTAGAVPVGFVGVWEDSDKDAANMALEAIAKVRDQGAQIVVAVVNWESQEPDTPGVSQIHLAHKLIDNGADLVVGVQPYALQGIEIYHDRYIAYSLGTFLSPDKEPQSRDAMIFQQTFTLSGDGLQGIADYNIIPCSIATEPDVNNCCPTPLTGDEAKRITDHIYDLSVELDGGISPKE